MKKIVALILGFILPGLMAAAVQAGPNDGSGTPQTEGLGSTQSGTSVQTTPPQGLSRRNKAVIRQSEAAQKRRALIESSATGTMPKKSGLSKRNKAKLKQAEESRKRRDKIQSGISPTLPK
jgi:hypothetical protein